jgi:hypothetical protein
VFGWCFWGVAGFLQTSQRLVHLTVEEAGKCCAVLVWSDRLQGRRIGFVLLLRS